jgi:hypothetical protein
MEGLWRVHVGVAYWHACACCVRFIKALKPFHPPNSTQPHRPERFVERFEALLQRVRDARQAAEPGGIKKGSSISDSSGSGAPIRCAVVGGGAGGVELAMALQHRLEQEGAGAGGVEVR